MAKRATTAYAAGTNMENLRPTTTGIHTTKRTIHGKVLRNPWLTTTATGLVQLFSGGDRRVIAGRAVVPADRDR